MNAQLEQSTIRKQKIIERFDGNFFPDQTILISYPSRAIDRCRMGILICQLALDENGDIQSISFDNELGLGIETAVTKALQQTEGQWLAGNRDTLEIRYSFDLFLNTDFSKDADIFIKNPTCSSSAIPIARMTKDELMSHKATSPINNSTKTCSTEQEILEGFLAFLKKKKTKKAIKYSEELLRRNPDSEHYQSLHRLVATK